MDNDDYSRDDYTTHILKAIGWSWFANRPQETNLRIAELEAEVKRLREAAMRLLPFLPTLDSGPAWHSEHARAAEALREALR